MTAYYQPKTNGGKSKCKYYKACGNTENCLHCSSYIKAEKEKKR